jgi:hypothetical protein
VSEVRLVAKAFDNLQAVSQPIFDDLAIAEREQGKAAARFRAEQRQPLPGCETSVRTHATDPDLKLYPGFCPPDSDYHSELRDPPATRQMRRAMALVGDYTQLLVILAEGRNIEEAQEQLQGLAGNIGSLVEMVGGPIGSTALAGAVAALRPLTELAAKRANSEELARVVVAESPKVQQVLLALRSASTELFNTVTEQSVRQFPLQAKDVTAARATVRRVEDYRVALSSYVVLLEQYGDLLRELVAYYEKPRSAVGLAQLNARSTELSTQADAWRRSLAQARNALR